MINLGPTQEVLLKLTAEQLACIYKIVDEYPLPRKLANAIITAIETQIREQFGEEEGDTSKTEVT
jgi:hypothetical protein